jgi:UMF1 family MFS transporter
MHDKKNKPTPQLNDQKATWGWVLYDWGNSAFATTVLAGFFPIFFKEYWSAGVDATISSARLGFTNSAAGLFVAILAPILGAIADRGTFKKNFLFIFTLLGIITTAMLYSVGQGAWQNAVLLFALANIGFSGAIIFYDALITDIASADRMHTVSAKGYAFGYLGGGLLFALNAYMTQNPQTFGLTSATEAVQFSFISVAIWWAIFAIPLFIWVKESSNPQTESGARMIIAGLSQLRETVRDIRHHKTVVLFLFAYWFYIDGVGTVIRMAVDYGMSIGFDSNTLLSTLILTQLVGFPSALLFGFLGNRIGAKSGIFIGITIYVFICIGGAFMQTPTEFYLLGIMVGIAQGGIQALSRSYFALLIPPDKSAEYFGFYNMLGKFAAVLGPAIMGGVGLLVYTMGYNSNIASRLSISAIALLFIVGGTLLYFVDEQKGQEETAYISAS